MLSKTAKIFNDEDEYITLFELSKSQKYNLEYLLNAASRGKLKSFKMGDDWLTTMDWFEDYKQSIRKAIQLEIADKETGRQKDWVDFLPDNGSLFKLLPQMVVILIIFSLFSFSLSWLAFSDGGHKLALSSSDFIAKRQAADVYFLYYTGRVFNHSHQYFSYLAGNAFYAVGVVADSLVLAGRDTAYLASVIDDHTGSYKFSDEIITEKINRLAGDIKKGYQAVAGAKSIRTQIYFEDWQKSSLPGN